MLFSELKKIFLEKVDFDGSFKILCVYLILGALQADIGIVEYDLFNWMFIG